MSVVKTIAAKLEKGDAIGVNELGGAAAIAAESDEIVVAPYLDILVSVTIGSNPDDWPLLDGVVIRGFRESDNALSFRKAANLLLDNPELRKRVSEQLQTVLIERTEARVNSGEGLIAAYALEALFRLALTGQVRKYKALDTLTALGPEADDIFAEHAAKLVGAAYHVWREDDLLDTLERLLDNDGAQGEASFELGLAHFAKAMEGDELSIVLQGLETSRVFFRDSALADEDRADAVAYLESIELVILFTNGERVESLSAPLDRLNRAVADRTRLLKIGSVPEWLKPRQDIEIQWVRFLRTVQCVATDLDRPSWLKASAVMSQLLTVYDADRTITGFDGLQYLFRPRIEAAFIRERGLLNHLDELLRDPEWQEAHGESTSALRRRIDELLEGSTLPGKAKEGALYPQLQRVLQDEQHIRSLPPGVAEQLERSLSEKVKSQENIADPIVQQILRTVFKRLSDCNDYTGCIRDNFDEVILQVVLFCKDRQDAGQKELGDRGKYLRDPGAKEADLQADLREWLVGNLRRGDVRTEVDGIATGRADIYVGFGGHRFIIELKRHQGMVDNNQARQYFGQAGSYQGTNVKLGMLGILELVQRQGPPAGLEECIWPEAFVPKGSNIARHLVVFRVPGMLTSPSSFSKQARSGEV